MNGIPRLIASTGEQNLYSYLDIIYANERVSIFANLTSVVILTSLYFGTVSELALVAWGGVWIINSAIQYWARPVYQRASGYSLSQKVSTYIAIGVVNCLCAGGSSLLFADSSLPHAFYIQALFISFYFTGVFTANAYIWPFYLASTATIILPFIGVSFMTEAQHAQAIGVGLAVMWLLVSLYANRYSFTFGESIRLQHERGELLAQLSVEKRRIERAHKAQQFFLSAISHDLKQPLYALRLLTDTQRNDNADVHALTKSMDKGIDDLEKMFDSILQIGEIEAEQISAHPEVFEITELLQSVHNTFRLIASNQDLYLRAVWFRTTAIKTDRLLLERIMANLVSNAIRYTDKGSVWIAWRPQRHCIEVRDSGIGIAPEHLKEIFGAFVQLAGPLPQPDSGVGLGLAICQRLCGLLNIKMTVRSELGRGSVFTLTLPESGFNPPQDTHVDGRGSVVQHVRTPTTADRADEYTV